MEKILLFGNSGSGKSTLARTLSTKKELAHLDLDTLAWLPGMPPRRAPVTETAAAIAAFDASNSGWVIEGCYADLLQLVTGVATEIIFLNLSVDACIDNARKRPWEPHKYPSKAAQDANLDMLLDWISQYADRQDEFSYAAHQHLYDTFTGTKRMLRENQPL